MGSGAEKIDPLPPPPPPPFPPHPPGAGLPTGAAVRRAPECVWGGGGRPQNSAGMGRRRSGVAIGARRRGGSAPSRNPSSGSTPGLWWGGHWGAKERSHRPTHPLPPPRPPPPVHLLKSGGKCLTQSTARLQTFVQNILIKILSDIDTHTNDRTLLS